MSPKESNDIDESLKSYSMDEVSKHNKLEDCWLIVGNMSNGKCLFSIVHIFNMLIESKII